MRINIAENNGQTVVKKPSPTNNEVKPTKYSHNGKTGANLISTTSFPAPGDITNELTKKPPVTTSAKQDDVDQDTPSPDDNNTNWLSFLNMENLKTLASNVPGWGWALLGLGVAGGGFLYYRRNTAKDQQKEKLSGVAATPTVKVS